MAANTEYTKIKESTISAFFTKLKAFFWPKADVVNLDAIDVDLADVAVTGDYDDLINKPSPGTPKATTIPAGGMLPNVYYALGTLTGSVTLLMASPTESGILNQYFFTFESGSTAPTITWSNLITSWFGGSAPTINASKHYEVSVVDGVGVCMEV